MRASYDLVVPAIILAALLLALIAYVVFAVLPRSNELFFASVRDGRLLIVRGQIPAGLRQDFEDIFKRVGTSRATLRAVKEVGHVSLKTRGADEFVSQRCRNVLGTYSIQNLSSAPQQGSRNLGQLVGLAWLAWILLPSE